MLLTFTEWRALTWTLKVIWQTGISSTGLVLKCRLVISQVAADGVVDLGKNVGECVVAAQTCKPLDILQNIIKVCGPYVVTFLN